MEDIDYDKFTAQFAELNEITQHRIIADLVALKNVKKKAKKKRKESEGFVDLSLDQRRQIIADLKEELAELRKASQQDQAPPAPAPIDDPNELVDDGELAQLRALWGTE